MPTHTTRAPFAPGAQGRLAPQAEADPSPGHTTKAMAERHEALWLSVTALHKDTIALGAKKPGAPVSDAVRVTVEGLLSDCAVYTRKRKERLPVAAPDLGGLAIQLGQALVLLDAWESRHTTLDARFDCRIWSLHNGYLPVMRLKPPAAALKFEQDEKEEMPRIRRELTDMIHRRWRAAYQDGFKAGQAAGPGAPVPSEPPDADDEA